MIKIVDWKPFHPTKNDRNWYSWIEGPLVVQSRHLNKIKTKALQVTKLYPEYQFRIAKINEEDNYQLQYTDKYERSLI